MPRLEVRCETVLGKRSPYETHIQVLVLGFCEQCTPAVLAALCGLLFLVAREGSVQDQLWIDEAGGTAQRFVFPLDNRPPPGQWASGMARVPGGEFKMGSDSIWPGLTKSRHIAFASTPF